MAEDLQWAIKGWVTPFHPEGWLRPFHGHYRPACRLFFTVCAHLLGDHWALYHLAVLALAGILVLITYRFLRRIGGLAAALATLLLVLWLASPFADEVLFVTNQVTQIFDATETALALEARSHNGRDHRCAMAAADSASGRPSRLPTRRRRNPAAPWKSTFLRWNPSGLSPKRSLSRTSVQVLAGR